MLNRPASSPALVFVFALAEDAEDAEDAENADAAADVPDTGCVEKLFEMFNEARRSRKDCKTEIERDEDEVGIDKGKVVWFASSLAVFACVSNE